MFFLALIASLSLRIANMGSKHHGEKIDCNLWIRVKITLWLLKIHLFSSPSPFVVLRAKP